jgi:UDP-N-acetylmuramoyl-tripeptide--D-alanyl-D-alanine ligase
MDPVTLAHVAHVTAGRLVRATNADHLVGPAVVTDSRHVSAGALFVAILGERTDGHAHLGQARELGAGAALVTREVDADLPQIVVADTVAAMAALARDVVTRAEVAGLTVVGITGSSGKTSTKDLVAKILGDAGPTVAPPGSFNNEIGAPLTACRVTSATRFLVSEMGARGQGHITALARMTRPSIGAVLNVGHAHLGEFGSVEAIAQAKGELVAALPPTGWAVLNADDPRVLGMAGRTTARLAVFSAQGDPGAQTGALRVWAEDAQPDVLQRYRFTLHAAGEARGHVEVRLQVLGEHQVSNALAAAAIALAAGVPLDAVAGSLSAATAASRWRMELVTRPDGVTILNDAYNANPDSMRAALTTLAGIRDGSGRLLAALGDMLELGEGAEAEHRALGELAARLGIQVLAVGDLGRLIAVGATDAGGTGEYLADVDALTGRLRSLVRPRDVVLVKASRGLALERVAEALAATTDEGDPA